MLRLSEHASYGRIEAARAARRFPVVLELLIDGTLTLTAVSLLRPHLTEENHAALLKTARHKSKRDVEQIVAALQPKPDVQSCIPRLPASATAAAAPRASAPSLDLCVDRVGVDSGGALALAAQGRPQHVAIAPLAPERYKLQVTLSGEGHNRLRCLQTC